MSESAPDKQRSDKQENPSPTAVAIEAIRQDERNRIREQVEALFADSRTWAGDCGALREQVRKVLGSNA